MRAIGANDLEEMVCLADDVLQQIRFSRYSYDSTGNRLPYEQIREKIGNGEEYFDFIGMDLIETIPEACEISLDEIINRYLNPYLSMSRGMFRTGGIGMGMYVQEDMSDDYLDKLLAIRCRDALIVCAAQREGRKNL